MKASSFLSVLLSVICSPLPEPMRSDRSRDWLGQCEESPQPYREALSFIPAVAGLCMQYEAPESMRRPVRWIDRFTLAASKLLVILIVLIIVSYAVLLTLTDTWSPSALHWVQTRTISAVFAAWVAWAGLSHDLQWLRSSRGGSAVMLFLMLSPPIIAGFIPATREAMGIAWVATLYTVMTWDAYWGVRTPLKTVGFLRRVRR